MIPIILQVAGTLLLVGGLALWSIPAALMLAGLAAITFGVAAERRD